MRILISAHTGLGNFILKTPVIRYVHNNYSQVCVDIIGGGSYGAEYVLSGTGLIDNTYNISGKSSLINKFMFFFRLRKIKYDAIFLPFDAQPIFLVLGSILLRGTKYLHINIGRRKLFANKIIHFIYMVRFPQFVFVPMLQGRHEIDLNYDLFEKYIDHPIERDYKTTVYLEEHSLLLDNIVLENEEYVVLQPSAANGSLTAKIWGVDNFISLIVSLRRKYNKYSVVLVGDKGDLDMITGTGLLDNDVVNLMGKTTVIELTAILNNAAVVVAHDSGVMHIANALNVNLIALYGPTDYTRTMPLGDNSRILFSHSDCFAKMYNSKFSEYELSEMYPNFECMSNISVDDVLDVIDEYLSST
jgi:ADP-heptose:LPS heptosyltransferase